MVYQNIGKQASWFPRGMITVYPYCDTHPLRDNMLALPRAKLSMQEVPLACVEDTTHTFQCGARDISHPLVRKVRQEVIGIYERNTKCQGFRKLIAVSAIIQYAEIYLTTSWSSALTIERFLLPNFLNFKRVGCLLDAQHIIQNHYRSVDVSNGRHLTSGGQLCGFECAAC
jgi:hypothetical protein